MLRTLKTTRYQSGDKFKLMVVKEDGKEDKEKSREIYTVIKEYQYFVLAYKLTADGDKIRECFSRWEIEKRIC